MITSRTALILKQAGLLRPNNTGQFQQKVRNGHGPWSYRVGPRPASKGIIMTAEFVGGFAWWWVLWHIITEPGHIIGEFELPDSRKWTDEELGIPSQDEE